MAAMGSFRWCGVRVRHGDRAGNAGPGTGRRAVRGSGRCIDPTGARRRRARRPHPEAGGSGTAHHDRPLHVRPERRRPRFRERFERRRRRVSVAVVRADSDQPDPGADRAVEPRVLIG
uniref:Uncharacterized protein n=1 Tax=Neobacillus citreus TaxID=2833578 RepID=A0A942T048_9BACI